MFGACDAAPRTRPQRSGADRLAHQLALGIDPEPQAGRGWDPRLEPPRTSATSSVSTPTTATRAARGGADARGIWMHEMVESIAAGRLHRASGELGAHVVEVARGIPLAAVAGRVVEIAVAQPDPLPVDAVA